MMLSLDTAYRSFGGEVEASSTPTICRLSDSRRHQLWAIAPHTSLLEGAKSEPRAKSRGAPANLSDDEKVSPHTSRGAPTHLNPFVPSEEIPSEERGAPEARPVIDS